MAASDGNDSGKLSEVFNWKYFMSAFTCTVLLLIWIVKFFIIPFTFFVFRKNIAEIITTWMHKMMK